LLGFKNLDFANFIMFSCDCPYCKEFESGHAEFKGANLGNRILFESKNFLVFPSIGQIVEGYLLIAPKKHYISVGGIPSALYKELESVQAKVRKVLTKNYCAPIFFEHGPASETKKAGCCVSHAHIHAVPVQLDVFPDLSKNFEFKKISSCADLKKQFEKGKPYFFLETNNCEKYLFNIPEIVPSQYIRKIIAEKIGKPVLWNWKVSPELETLVKTHEKLKAKFQ
jgi:diadenosine tetraphosphate (Ap4A) HIT family hydrolase